MLLIGVSAIWLKLSKGREESNLFFQGVTDTEVTEIDVLNISSKSYLYYRCYTVEKG